MLCSKNSLISPSSHVRGWITRTSGLHFAGGTGQEPRRQLVFLESARAGMGRQHHILVDQG